MPSPTTTVVQVLHPHDEHAVHYVYVPDPSDLNQRTEVHRPADLRLAPGSSVLYKFSSENRGT